ncbi:Maf family protein [Zavarzinella formosa]|uniref:Maf family protein n=1 Tax=Zavarzinella formosa TaxID=360055 RepID=UPI0002F0B257|nr:Maf family protein [Zavarzinella formosa]
MGITLPFRLTLASGSRGRRYLMEKLGYTFDVKPSNVDEPTEAVNGDIRGYVQHVAWIKAAAVGPTVSDGIVISGDSVAWIDGHVVGKPEDEADARRILKSLSGRVHELWTGVCLWRCADGMQFQWQELSRVRMRELSDDELDALLKTNQWVGCSGAYSIAEENDPYLTVETGTMSNVIGLPMESLAVALKEFGR